MYSELVVQDKLLERIAPQLDWLANSGIQVATGPDAGGVRAWINEENGEGSYIYSEITGYFMSLAVHVARHDPDGGWLERADKAANWIATVAMDAGGAVLTRKYDNGVDGRSDPYCFDKGLTAFFDCAMVGFGLANVYEETGDRRWLETARKIADFCLASFQSADGRERHAAYDTKAHKPLPEGDKWSQHWGSFELKGAMFMDSMFRITGDERYRRWVEDVLPGALADQKEDGRFGTNLPRTMTHLHPHNYTIEGLLYLLGRHDRAELRRPVQRGVEFSFQKCLDPAGRMVQAWSKNDALTIPGLRSDVLAQSLRSYYAARLLDPGFESACKAQISSLFERMGEYTLPSGGTSYGEDEHGRKSRHANAWCHFFNTEMRMLEAIHANRLDWNPREIILT